MTERDFTTVSIKKDTKTALMKHGAYGDSMDDILRKMLRVYEHCLKQHAQDMKEVAENHLI